MYYNEKKKRLEYKKIDYSRERSRKNWRCLLNYSGSSFFGDAISRQSGRI